LRGAQVVRDDRPGELRRIAPGDDGCACRSAFRACGLLPFPSDPQHVLKSRLMEI
jgi:hypothetical protein